MRKVRVWSLSLAVLAAAPAWTAEVGTNLDAVVDFSPQYPFVDAFKQSRIWITQNATAFDTGEQDDLDLDNDGYVRFIPNTADPRAYDRVAALLFFSGSNAAYPAGTYIVTYDGEGVIEYRFDAVKNLDLSEPHRDVLTVTPDSGFAIVIRSTTLGNHIRNIHVWMPGFTEVTGPTQVFHPDFLDLIQPFTVLRFMDWMHTNNSPQSNFSSRPRVTDAQWTIDGKGVPLETMIDLSNRADKDPWFNMPHKATDQYVSSFATLVKNTLETNRKVYVEYSNEVWNSQFQQGSFIEEQGQAEFATADSGFTKRLNWHGQRTAEICDIWQSVFAAQASRVICVIGSQAANAFTATEAMDCPLSALTPCHAHNIDALAIAPYFGGYLGASETATAVAALPLTDLFTEITAGGVVAGGPTGGAIAETRQWVIDNRAAATARGKALVSYEGGQHLVGFFGAENNVALANKLVAANRDGRMGDAYLTYLHQWEDNGGELFMHFTSAGSYSKFGSWGAVERLDTLDTPKNNALRNFIDGQVPPTPQFEFSSPNPSVTEGAATARVSVTRLGSSGSPVTVQFATANGSATAPSDYSVTTGVLSFGAGVTTRAFTVPIVNDTRVEGTETVRLRLHSPSPGAELGGLREALLNIKDNDGQAVFFANAAVRVLEGTGQAAVTIQRTGPTSTAASVRVATAGGSATSGADFTARNVVVSFGVGVSSVNFNIPILVDALAEGDESFKVALSAPTGGLVLGTQKVATVTLEDDDADAVFLSPTSLTVAEGAGQAVLTVHRTRATVSTAVVTYASTDGSAIGGSDHGTVSNTAFFDEGEATATVAVPILQDTLAEGDEVLRFELNTPNGLEMGTQSAATVLIKDDDGKAVYFKATAVSVGEAGAQVSLTVERSGALTAAASVRLVTQNLTAAAGADYTSQNVTVGFAAGVASAVVRVPIRQDAVDEPDETFRVTLSSPSGVTLGTQKVATVTVKDDD